MKIAFFNLFILIIIFILYCDTNDPQGLDSVRNTRFDVYFTTPGTDQNNGVNAKIDEALINLIDDADYSIDIAFMGFNKQNIIDAIKRAYYRGIKIRFVGDASYVKRGEVAYVVMENLGIPIVCGNDNSIMHNKFGIFDRKLIFFSTANITNTDLVKSYNNAIIIESISVALLFQSEFEQLFSGRFGDAKDEDKNRVFVEKQGGTYTNTILIRNTNYGDVELEVYFAPHMNCVGHMVDHVNKATNSLYFTIFAFTKDEIGGAFTNKKLEGIDVKGVLDKSQIYGNGPGHEIYRLCSHGVHIRMDGNENTNFHGDAQGGGGRLHSKTMVIDYDTDKPVVITGSFNWSNSATRTNDETLVIVKNKQIANLYKKEFDKIWNDSKEIPGDYMNGTLEYQDVIINEVNWKGSIDNNSSNIADECKKDSDDTHPCDEFIELRNLSDRVIDLSYWTINNAEDVIFGFPENIYLYPGAYVLAVDHLGDAYSNADFVLNVSNDYRFPRMILRNASFYIELRDRMGNVIDKAGNGSEPFNGGLINGKVYSMERKNNFGEGNAPFSWFTCNLDKGGNLVDELHKSNTICTPGEANSSE